MKKIERVKKSQEFDNIIKNNKYVKNDAYVIYYNDNESIISRFGISVGKKIGNAVKRNYFKRVTRNICDINKNLYSKPKDYIIIVRKGCEKLSFDEKNESFISLINKIQLKEKDLKNEKEK
jgi:ribonuclease P protein component